MFDIYYCPNYPLDEVNASTQIRKEGMDEYRPALAENISKQGLVNPLIILNHRDPVQYKERWLKTGNNRYWALLHLGWTHAPAFVTGRCEHPCIKVTLEEAQQYVGDGRLVYLDEAYGGVLQMQDVCRPELYEYPNDNTRVQRSTVTAPATEEVGDIRMEAR